MVLEILRQRVKKSVALTCFQCFFSKCTDLCTEIWSYFFAYLVLKDGCQVSEYQSLSGWAEKDSGEANQEEKGAVFDVYYNIDTENFSLHTKCLFSLSQSVGDAPTAFGHDFPREVTPKQQEKTKFKFWARAHVRCWLHMSSLFTYSPIPSVLRLSKTLSEV